MVKRTSKIATEFIDDQEIQDTLEFAQQNKSNRELIDGILERARNAKGCRIVKPRFCWNVTLQTRMKNEGVGAGNQTEVLR